MAEQHTEVVVLSATITPNPAKTRQQITISVTAVEIIVEPWYYSGEIYAGEV